MNRSQFEDTPQGVDPLRINAFILIVVVIFLVFLSRLITFQVLEYEEWLDAAEENRTNTISTPTQRGVIFDRNGIILAQNIASYNVVITPADLPDDDGEIQEIFRGLSDLIDVPVNKGSIDEPLIPCGDNLGIRQMFEIGETFAPFQPVLIRCDIPRELALVVQERAVDWSGVSIIIEPVRDYPTGELTATFVGFLGPIPALQEDELRALGFLPGRDKVGYAGVEFSFNDVLQGTAGQRVVEIDVAGQILRDIEAPIPPEAGQNVVLTIDTRLQHSVDAIVRGEVDFWNTWFGELRISSGVAIAMDPRTGEILAMVSFPSYENNRLARFIPTYYYEQLIADSTQPLLNNAVGAELPAGSVFKIVTSVGALNEVVVTPDQIIQTPPLITIQERYFENDPGNAREFVDWNDAGFGSLDFIGGISNSSNVYFYKLGGGYEDEVDPGLGICRLGTYARAMGFDEELGIELPDEADGLIPDPTWKRRNQGENWSIGDTYIASVGQGFMIATPLQILNSAAIIANGGIVMQPTIVREVLDGEGNVVQVVVDEDANIIEALIDESGNILDVFPDEDLGVTSLIRDEDNFILSLVLEDGRISDLTTASPFFPNTRWDLTQDPMIEQYENPEGIGSCRLIRDEDGDPELSTVEPWVFELIQQGMRRAVTHGTLEREFEGLSILAAGKTGTAEYCDVVALENDLCIPGNWPTHSWTVAYAPFDEPEIVVVAFMYNGGEGASVAGPVVRMILEAYFELKAIDAALGIP